MLSSWKSNLAYCNVDFDSLDDDKFGISIKKSSDDFVGGYQQLVGNKQWLVIAKMNQGHSHSRLFSRTSKTHFLCSNMSEMLQVYYCRNEPLYKQPRLVDKGQSCLCDLK